MDYYGFYTGKEFSAYEYLGAHVGPGGTVFRTFAPGAAAISVIGEFNGWQETPMQKVYDGNFWECTVPEAAEGQMYKYRIYKKDGSFIDHCDPYGFYMELRPHSASIITSLSGHEFKDAKWRKKQGAGWDKPLNIYEVHAGSWRKKAAGGMASDAGANGNAADRATEKKHAVSGLDENAAMGSGTKAASGTEAASGAETANPGNGWYSYTELAEILIPYLKENHYNYLELMPLSEHPSDESWGYQNTGFFSPTSRYGTPEELREFIDRCHEEEIGVIMDFVPVHFAVDDYALWNYDGTALYEYPHNDVGRSEWGSCNFMHSRGEVRSFLQSAANYWLKEFHFDGLRMDAVSNLIYWQGNTARGENLNGIQFLREMNTHLKTLHPGALLIAEDSSTYPGVTKPAKDGGLGFDYKWDMGWMNDTLSYFQAPPSERKEKYHKLTFSMQYYYNERYLLPLSHDEVVHGKATILQKMYGDYEGKFPQARALYLYMYAHPGKKLNFMGNEFGQLREWDEKREQDWDILKYPLHDAFARFMRDLNEIYLENPALSALDYDRTGFQWLDCHQEGRLIYAFERTSEKQRIAAVFNFSDEPQEDYSLPVPGGKHLQLLIASDMDIYGAEPDCLETEVDVIDGHGVITLAPYSGRYYLVEN